MEHKIELAQPIKGLSERDAYSKALLNTDMNGLIKYKMQREKHFQNLQEMARMKTDISTLREELGEIKQLLLMISKKNST